MSHLLRLILFITGCGYAIYILSLLVRKRINERNTLIWLVFTIVMLTLSAYPYLLDRVAEMVGVDYPPSLLFLVSLLLLMLVVLYQSIQISVLTQKVKEMGQNVALKTYLEPSTSARDVGSSPSRQERTNAGGVE